METNFITFTTEISELKLNKLTNTYYFKFKYNISDNEYHTVDLTRYNEYQSEGIRKDFIDMISNMNKIAVDLSKQIENGDILYNSHNIKLEGQKPVNNYFSDIKIEDNNEKESESLSDKIKQMELVVENANKYAQKMVDEQVAILNRNRKEFSDIKKEDLELIEEQFKTLPFELVEVEDIKESDSIKRAVGYDEKGNMLFIEHTLKDFQELNKKVKKLSEKNKKLKAKNKKLTKKLRKLTAINTGE